MAHRLSKSRFVAGWQCPKLLWWRVHEPHAKELEPDVVLRDLFDQGLVVDARAREEWTDGLLIESGERGEASDRDRDDAARVARTREAVAADTPAIFGACFEADGAFCVVDVLERTESGWTLIEVKSASEVKDYHLPDVAFQVYVARRAGLNVTRAEVMHLNREYRHLAGLPLFVRADVTQAIDPLMPEIPDRTVALVEVLDGPLPEVTIGSQCFYHNDCAFMDRCWPDDPDHIRNMIGVGAKKTVEWMQKGVHTMSAIPSAAKLNDKQRRQLRAQREGRPVVEPGLADAVQPAVNARRLGFLDFETVGRAIPVWDSLGPWHQAAAQFSYHERGGGGVMSHAEFLAEGPEDPSQDPDDPREPIARAMLAATANADLVVVYSSFEKSRINDLAAFLPQLAEPLFALRDKLWDLLPVVNQNVYHPGFGGSFSLKYVLNPLVPDLSYDDLVIVDGKTASVEIARLLFVSGRIPPAERDKTRRALLEYCERDTLATVRLVERLIELSRG